MPVVLTNETHALVCLVLEGPQICDTVTLCALIRDMSDRTTGFVKQEDSSLLGAKWSDLRRFHASL